LSKMSVLPLMTKFTNKRVNVNAQYMLSNYDTRSEHSPSKSVGSSNSCSASLYTGYEADGTCLLDFDKLTSSGYIGIINHLSFYQLELENGHCLAYRQSSLAMKVKTKQPYSMWDSRTEISSGDSVLGACQSRWGVFKARQPANR
jgi:hypothetical protein